MAFYANVIIDISHEKLDRTFQYRIPEKLCAQIYPGVQVEVPFGNGNRRIRGFVVEVTDRAEFDVGRIKDIGSVVTDAVAIEAQLIALAAFMRTNYGGTMNQALKTVIPVKHKTKQREKRTLKLVMEREAAARQLDVFVQKHNTARARLLKELLLYPSLSYEVVTQKLNISPAVIRALEERQILKVEKETDYRNPIAYAKAGVSRIRMNGEQEKAVEAVRFDMQNGNCGTYLLHGVTGSGKTEIYLQMIADVLEMGKQAVVLVPEIALTPLILERFLSRFGEKVSVTHSRLSTGERVDQWKRARDGEISVIIGPRSALFLPFADIGAIIIDEAHETSYLSDVTPKYDAREAAEKLAELHGALLLMGTATPDISAYYKATQGEYRLLELKERTGGGSRPEIFVTDMRQELAEGNRSVFGQPLRKALAETLERGEQAMLFLNRRGYATFVSCRSCGHAMVCPECDLPYTYHATENILLCHTCGRREASPRVCPECGSGYIRQFGTGTEKIEEETRRFFPNARILRMDLDTTAKKHSHERILAAFSQKEADILIGTQMIAKGHDFASITLVGIMAADTSLNTDSYTAAETGFRLMLQAAGRTGRAGLPGRVYLQTYQPEHYSVVTASAQDYGAFYAQEIEYRRMMLYPPVWNLLVILCASGKQESAADASARLAGQIQSFAAGREDETIYLIGPADAAIAKINDIYQKLIYIKARNYQTLVAVKDMAEAYTRGKREYRDVILQFDFNPAN